MSSSDIGTVNEEEGNIQISEDDEQELTESCGTKTYDFSTKTWREDMELIVEGRKLFVASNILSLLSPVFTSMFDEQFKGEGPKVIELLGKKLNDVTEFLRCIYPNIRKTVSVDNVQNILPLADEFKVIELKQTCEDFLIETTTSKTTPEDICIRLQLAYHHKLNYLKDKCMKRAASTNIDKFTVAETKYPLPLEIKIQIKDIRIVQLSKTVAQLQKRESDLKNRYQNLIDVVKYFWIEKGYNSNFKESEFGALTLTIKDVSTFDVTFSPLECVKGICWSLYVKKNKSEDGVEHLSIFVAADAPTQWKDWSCESMSQIMILDNNTGKHGEATLLQHIFTSKSTCYGYPTFIKINELLSKEKGFVVNDALTIKAFFLAKEPVSKPFIRK